MKKPIKGFENIVYVTNNPNANSGYNVFNTKDYKSDDLAFTAAMDFLQKTNKEAMTNSLVTQKLEKFLAAKHSRMESSVNSFITYGRIYGIDPKLMVAIATKESGAGKIMCGKFNPFGVMSFSRVNGKTVRHCRNFSSFDEAIRYEAALLAQYKALGKSTVEEIAYKYNPDTPKEWITGIYKILKQIG